MKIMYVIHSLTVGGAETIVTNYLIQLKKMGKNVVLVQMYNLHTFLNERLKQEEIPVYTVSENRPGSLIDKIREIYRFRKIIRDVKPDIIHVHTGLEKFRFVRFPAERIVFTLHSELKRSLKSGKNHKKMFLRLARRGMHIIALSEKAEADIKACLPEAKTTRIPNGFCFDIIGENRYKKSEFLKTINVPETAFVVGHVGRFHKVKNHEKLIEVFSQVLEKQPEAYLLLVGNGSGDEEERVRQLVKEKQLEERVLFLGLRKDATAVMSIFDVLVLPSYSEAFPLVLIEAQILKIRCVASTGVPEDVCCNPDCIRLPLEESARKWADVILGNCIQKEEKELLQYSIEKVIERHLQLYDGIVRIR